MERNLERDLEWQEGGEWADWERDIVWDDPHSAGNSWDALHLLGDSKIASVNRDAHTYLNDLATGRVTAVKCNSLNDARAIAEGWVNGWS